MEEKKISELENYIHEIMTEDEVRGLAVSVINDHGESLYRQFFGERDAEQHLPVDENTIFGLASVTKSFTAASILQMAEEGRISLEDPISKYISSYQDPSKERIVRIRDLLSHAGGFLPQYRHTVEEELPKTDFKDTEEDELIYNEAFAEYGICLVAGNLSRQTAFTGKPGERMSYSNDSFGLLSDIIRTQSDCASFAEYLEKHILQPLGMSRSTCSFLKPAKDENAAVLYSKEDGKWRGDHDYYHHAFILNGGGAMKSTLRDMEKYVGMYLQYGGAVLNPYIVAEMEKPRVNEKPGVWYGYGLECRAIPGTDYTVIQHGGSLPGVSSNIAWSHEAGIGVVVLCNTNGVSVGRIADALLRVFIGLEMLPEKVQHPSCAWSEEYTSAITGRYESEEDDWFEVSQKDGKLFLVRESGTLEIHPAWKNTGAAVQKHGDVYVQFLEDEEGEIFAARCGSRILPRKELSMEYCFCKASGEDAKAVYALIEQRVEWMNRVGIHQWNDTDYLNVYPHSYYEEYQSQLYVLREQNSGRVVCAAILLEQDDRWNLPEPAFYVHNFVSDVQVSGCGSLFLQKAEELAVKTGKEYLRLDSAEDNRALKEYYERHGFEACGTCEEGLYHGILRQKKVKVSL